MTRKRKKNKKKNISANQLQKIIANYFKKNPKKRVNAKQVIKKLRLPNSKDSVNHAFRELEKQGILYEIKEGRYKLNNRMPMGQAIKMVNTKTFIGKVDLTRSGAAYIVSPDSEIDIYVPARFTRGAFNDDLVKVEVPQIPGRIKPEGKIVEIIKRNTTHVIGVVNIFNKYASVIPVANPRLPEVHVKFKDLGKIIEGTFVVAEITDWGINQNKAVWGKIVRTLEKASENDIAMQSIIYSNGFEIEFPKEVLQETNDIPGDITQQEISRRRDFREITTFTIDPESAKDFDDALSYQELDNGVIEIGIHIADVTHYVKENSHLDKEALERSTSVYLVDRVVPMLPERLSNDLCSLNPEVDRLVFSAVFKFNEKLKVIDQWFGKGIIHSDKRFTYEEAQSVIDQKKGPFVKELLTLNKVSKYLRKERFKNGSINFESEEIYFELDDNAHPIALKVKDRIDTHMLIEDFMLLANRRVAAFISNKSKNPIPFVYRVHDLPNPDKLADFALFAKELGVHMNIDTPQNIARSFNSLAERTEKEEKLKLLEPLAIRTMSKAEYTTDNIGHYGLAFDHYAHFTSPIRRYADVLVHRLLEKNLKGEFRVKKDNLEAKCRHISAQERKANDAERESVKYKQVEYILDKIGTVQAGIISGIIDKGIFVMLEESRAEGLISFATMDESYEVDSSRLFATGRRSRSKFKMGDKVKVKVLDADLDTRLIDLELIVEESDNS